MKKKKPSERKKIEFTEGELLYIDSLLECAGARFLFNNERIPKFIVSFQKKIDKAIKQYDQKKTKKAI